MLKSLIDTAEETGLDRSAVGTVNMFPLKKIRRSNEQARRKFDPVKLQGLAQSIREHGLLQPMVIQSDGRLVAGERRFRACQIAGLLEAPVIMRDMEDAEESFLVGLVENLQRVDLTPMEEAWGFGELRDKHKLTQDQIAAKVGKSRPVIANTLRLLKLPGSVQDLLQNESLTAGHALELLALEEYPTELKRLADDCISSDWTVLELRQNVSFVLNKLKPQPAPATQAPAQPAASSQVHPDEHLDPAFGAAIKQQPDNSEIKAPATQAPAPVATNGNVVQTQSGGFSATNAKPVAPPVAEIDAARNDALYEQFQAEDEQAEIYLSQPEPGDTTALTFFDGQVLIQLGRLDVDLSNVLEKYTGYRVSITVDLFTEKGATSFDQITVGEGATR